MARNLVTILVLSLLVLGCGGVRHLNTTLSQQDTIIVWVEPLPNNKAKATPNKVVLVDDSQKVAWYACEGDLQVVFDPSTNPLPNPACANSGNRRCDMNAPAPGTKKGSHKYTVILTIQGQQHQEDPVIIVDY